MTMTTTVPLTRTRRVRTALTGRPQVPAPARVHVVRTDAAPDIVDVWGNDSFPASDAPANW